MKHITQTSNMPNMRCEVQCKWSMNDCLYVHHEISKRVLHGHKENQCKKRQTPVHNHSCPVVWGRGDKNESCHGAANSLPNRGRTGGAIRCIPLLLDAPVNYKETLQPAGEGRGTEDRVITPRITV
uniref:Uncharacterized protein n=1 Tax=Anguilla anguilla TaxID=7936 RepID=A0A0E9WRY6_ANGAN